MSEDYKLFKDSGLEPLTTVEKTLIQCIRECHKHEFPATPRNIGSSCNPASPWDGNGILDEGADVRLIIRYAEINGIISSPNRGWDIDICDWHVTEEGAERFEL